MADVTQSPSVPHSTVEKLSGNVKDVDMGKVLETIDEAPFGRRTDGYGIAANTRSNDALDHFEATKALGREGERVYTPEFQYIGFLDQLVEPMPGSHKGSITTGEFNAVYPPVPSGGVEVTRVDEVAIDDIKDANLRAAAERIDETRPGRDQSPLGRVTYNELKAAYKDDLMHIYRRAVAQISKTYLYEASLFKPGSQDLELYSNPEAGVRLTLNRQNARRSGASMATDTRSMKIEVPEGCSVMLAPLNKNHIKPVVLKSRDSVIALDVSKISTALRGFDLCNCALVVVKPSNGAPGTMPEVVDRATVMLDVRNMGSIAAATPVKKPLLVT